VVEHAAHLALPSFVDRYLYPGVGFFLPYFPDPRRRGLAVLEEHAPFEHVDHAVFEHSLDLCQIGLRKLMLRVRDQVRKVPVIRQEQKPLRIIVQPPNGVHADLDAFQKVLHRGPPLGVGHGRDKACRLVQHDIRRRLLRIDEFAVYLDVVLGGIRLGPKLGHHLAVHRHAALGDELLRCAARGHSSG
jgi:hypothetical protein